MIYRLSFVLNFGKELIKKVTEKACILSRLSNKLTEGYQKILTVFNEVSKKFVIRDCLAE